MFIGAISQYGIVFKYNCFFDKILKNLTINKTKRLGQKYITREEYLYRIVDNNILFSRFAYNDLCKLFNKFNVKYKFKNKISDGKEINIFPGPILDSNQQIVSDYLNEKVYNQENIRKGMASCVLVMKTGSGKTFVGCAKIRDLKKKTLIIVPNEVILNEWKKALIQSYPNLKIGFYYGKIKTDGDVVIMIINSALNNYFKFSKKIKYYEYFKQFGFIIYDEIHNYTSFTRQKIFWRTNRTYGLGLTATPDENEWQMDIIFEKHVGPIIKAKDIPNYKNNQIKWYGKIIPIYYRGPPEFTKTLYNQSTGYVSHSDMVNQFCSDPQRNQLIINLIRKLYNRGRNIFVFFKLRSYADILLNSIVKQCNIKKTEKTKDALILMGGAKKSIRENAETARIILTTYKYGWQGLSIPKMDTLIFATPRKAKIKQIIGRIIRQSGDPSIPRLIYDIIDYNTNLGKAEWSIRKKILLNKEDYNFTII